MDQLLNESYLTVALDPEHQWLYANWRGDQNMNTVRTGCLHLIDLVRRHGATKLLNDNREVTTSWSEAADWVGTYCIPELAEAGLKHLAWVYSPSSFSHLSTDLSISFAKGVVHTATFDSCEKAEAWLAAQN
jgi:hypothetical protein